MRNLFSGIFIILTVVLTAQTVHAADSKPPPKVVELPPATPSKNTAITTGVDTKANQPVSAGSFAEIAFGGNIWVVEAGALAVDSASCAAYAQTGPYAFIGGKDLAIRMDFTRSKTDNVLDETAILAVYAQHDPNIYDKAIMFDDVSVVANKQQKMRIVQRFRPDILKERLQKTTFVKFALAGKTAQLPAALFLQLLDKLDACAALKKAP